MSDPESKFAMQLVYATPQVKEAFEKLTRTIRSLDQAVFPYFTKNKKDLRYSTRDVPETWRGYHPFAHISSHKTKLELHLKDVDDPKGVTKPRSSSKAILERHFRSFPRKTAVKGADDVDKYLTGLLTQSLWIMRKDYLEGKDSGRNH